MAYATGIVGTTEDLISSLVTFLTPFGWSLSGSWVTGSTPVRYLTKGGIHFGITISPTLIQMNTATGLTGSGSMIAQPGACYASAVGRPFIPPFLAYHFFTDGDRVSVVVEPRTNAFCMFSFGFLEKLGIWEGGAYIATNDWTDMRYSPGEWPNRSMFDRYVNGSGPPPTHVRVTQGDRTLSVVGSVGPVNTVPNWLGAWSYWLQDADLVDRSPNVFNSRTVIVPLTFFYSSNSASSPPGWRQLGYLPNIGTLNMKDINPREVVNGDWMVFPWCEKNGPNVSPYINSRNLGWAFKR